MLRKFTFALDTFGIQTLHSLQGYWKNIPDPDAKKAIATENQYYLFHRFLLESLRHEHPTNKTHKFPLGLSVRAGALKTCRLLTASIVEAALRAHAENLGIQLKGNPTLMDIINRIKKSEHKAKFSEILPLAKKLNAARNDVHLYHQIDKARDFATILASEIQMHADDESIIFLLRSLKTNQS